MKISRDRIPILATAGVLLLLYGIASMAYDGFFSARVFANFFTDNAFLGVTAIGMTAVILSKGIDLSVGSVIGFTTIFIAFLVEDMNAHPILAWAMALVIGTGFGTIMGLLIVVYELPAFLVTLGGLFFARGMAFVVNSTSIGIDSPFYDAILDFQIQIGPRAYWGVSPIVFLLFLGLVVYLLRWSRYGRYIYAVGGNEDSARLMGMPVDRIKIGVYAFNGFCSALAGILTTLYMLSGNPLTGVALELDAIAAVVIGGTLLTGGYGGAVGTLFGVLIFAVIKTILDFGGYGTVYQRISIAALLLFFILIQRFLARGRD